MIKTLADLLYEVRVARAGVLEDYGITHGPTIGEMYEGLTRDLLDRAIPEGLDLRVVSGFVRGHDGQLSSQVDIMLVTGCGEQIPHIDKYIWPVLDVLAVLEVKKTLYAEEMKDAVEKMNRVTDLAKDAWTAGLYEKSDYRLATKVFAKLTGFKVDNDELQKLNEGLQLIHFSTFVESVFPLRIVWAYEGYRTEEGLRQGADSSFADKDGTGRMRGFVSLPSLVVCGNLSLVKLNGFPYYSPGTDMPRQWDAMASSSDRPERMLLELIWTRISAVTSARLPMDDTLELERLSLLFRFEFLEQVFKEEVRSGFAMRSFAKVRVGQESAERAWAPGQGDEGLAEVTLWAAREEYVDIADDRAHAFGEAHGMTLKGAVTRLVAERTMAWCNVAQTRAVLIEPEVAIVLTPDGDVKISDEPGLLHLWISKTRGN